MESKTSALETPIMEKMVLRMIKAGISLEDVSFDLGIDLDEVKIFSNKIRFVEEILNLK